MLTLLLGESGFLVFGGGGSLLSNDDWLYLTLDGRFVFLSGMYVD